MDDSHPSSLLHKYLKDGSPGSAEVAVVGDHRNNIVQVLHLFICTPTSPCSQMEELAVLSTTPILGPLLGGWFGCRLSGSASSTHCELYRILDAVSALCQRDHNSDVI